MSDSVSSRPARPSNAKYSVCTGTITRSAATSALIVSGPSDGGQSSSTKAYRSRNGSSTWRSRPSDPSIRGSSMFAPARSGVELRIARWSTPVGRTASIAATSSHSTS